jgi:quinol monooxygenase YgiN
MTESRMMLAELHGLIGRTTDLRALLSELAVATRREDGCESFRVLDSEDPAGIVLLSIWKDESAMRSHFTTRHYARYREQVGPLLARPSDVVVHHISETIHALDPDPPDPSLFD